LTEARGANPNPNPKFELFGQVRSFNWNEFADGEELLEESGALFGVGLRLVPAPLTPVVQGRTQVYFGEVEYDGQTLAGEPLTDTTAYWGAMAEADLLVPAWVAKKRDKSVGVFAGFGGDTWQRELGTENEDSSYTEEWYVLYARAGAGWYLLRDNMVRGHVIAGVKVPVFARNHVDVEDVDGTESLDLEPEGQPGPFVEAGWRWNQITASIFYEYVKFDQSDEETILFGPDSGFGALAVDFYQPESEMHLFGVNVGVVF
jgi:hypothetical protein